MAALQRTNVRVMPLGYRCVQNMTAVMRHLSLSYGAGEAFVVLVCDAATVPQCRAPDTFAVSVIVKLKQLMYLVPVKHHATHIVKYSECFKLDF